MKIKPMLAYTIAAKEIDWSKKVYAQPKLDGVRCLLTKDGGYSRTGKKFKNITHIELAFVKFFKNNPDAVLDGELYNHKLKDDFEKIISKYMGDYDYTDFANGETRCKKAQTDIRNENW